MIFIKIFTMTSHEKATSIVLWFPTNFTTHAPVNYINNNEKYKVEDSERQWYTFSERQWYTLCPSALVDDDF